MAVEIEHEAQKELFTRIEGYLRQSFGELVDPAEQGRPGFWLMMGRIPLAVCAYPMAPTRQLWDITSFLGQEINVNEDVMKFLLTKNSSYRFGTLYLDDEEGIRFDHSLVGESTTKDSLALVQRLMSRTVDDIDDALNMQFTLIGSPPPS
jgi:Putative bacterial sensory transduction regulator